MQLKNLTLILDDSDKIKFTDEDVVQFQLTDVIPTYYEKGFSNFTKSFWLLLHPNANRTIEFSSGKSKIFDKLKEISISQVIIDYNDDTTLKCFVPYIETLNSYNIYQHNYDINGSLYISINKDFNENEVPSKEIIEFLID